MPTKELSNAEDYMRRRFSGTFIPDVLLEDWMPHLTGAEVKILLCLIHDRDEEIPLSRIASETGLNKETICRSLASLEEKNILARTRRSSKEQGSLPNLYKINVAAQYPIQEAEK